MYPKHELGHKQYSLTMVFPDIYLTAVKFPDVFRISRQVVALYIVRWNINCFQLSTAIL